MTNVYSVHRYLRNTKKKFYGKANLQSRGVGEQLAKEAGFEWMHHIQIIQKTDQAVL